MPDTTYVFKATTIASTSMNAINRRVYQDSVSVENDPYLATGNGTTNDRAAITAADAVALAAGRPLFFPPGSFKIASDLTISSNVIFAPGAKLVVPTGVTVTLAGHLDAPATQIFSLSGTGAVVVSLMLGSTSFCLTSVAPVCYPEWWGAVMHDSSSAQMTLNVLAWTKAINSHMTVVGGAGTYYLNGAITPTSSAGTIMGAGQYTTTLQATTSAAILSFALLVNFRIVGMTFLDGTQALTFNTQNVDSALITVDDCVFRNQSGVALEAQSGSNSTEFNVLNSVWVATSQSGATFIKSYADYTRCLRCWAVFDTTGAVFENRSGTFTVRELVGVPSGGAGTTACWMKNYSNAELYDNRFGSEDTVGRTVLHQMAGGILTVYIENNLIICNDYAFKFEEFPESVTIRGNSGYGLLGGTAARGIWCNASSTTKAYMERGRWILDDQDAPPEGYFSSQGSNSLGLQSLVYAKLVTNTPQQLPSELLFDDAVVSALSQTVIVDRTNTNVTVGTGAYQFLGGVTTKMLTCTANQGLYVGFTTAYIGVVTTDLGIYTGVIDFYVSVTTRPFWFEIQMGNVYFRQQLVQGLNVICFQLQPDSAATEWTITMRDLPNTAVIYCGRLRMFKGAKNIRTVETVYTDSSAGTIPNSANITHSISDRVQWMNPISGGFSGQVCTTAGTPGTFKNFGAIA